MAQDPFHKRGVAYLAGACPALRVVRGRAPTTLTSLVAVPTIPEGFDSKSPRIAVAMRPEPHSINEAHGK